MITRNKYYHLKWLLKVVRFSFSSLVESHIYCISTSFSGCSKQNLIWRNDKVDSTRISSFKYRPTPLMPISVSHLADLIKSRKSQLSNSLGTFKQTLHPAPVSTPVRGTVPVHSGDEGMSLACAVRPTPGRFLKGNFNFIFIGLVLFYSNTLLQLKIAPNLIILI